MVDLLDSGIILKNTVWDDNELKDRFHIGAKVDVEISHVRDPHRYVWALECKLLNVDQYASRLQYLGHPPLHIRPEDQRSVDQYADILEAAGRSAPIIPMDDSEKVKSWRNVMFDKLSHDPATTHVFAEDYEEVELQLKDPTISNFDEQDIEFYRARNSYFIHRYLWETGEPLASNNPDFMFRNSIQMHLEIENGPQRMSAEHQYPLTNRYRYWSPKQQYRKPLKYYEPESEQAARYRKPGLGNDTKPFPFELYAMQKSYCSQAESEILAGHSECPLPAKSEIVDVLNEAILLRRHVRRDVSQNPERFMHLMEDCENIAPTDAIDAITRKLEPQFEAEIDHETGEISLSGVFDMSQIMSEKVDEGSEQEDVIRFTDQEIESFTTIDDLED